MKRSDVSGVSAYEIDNEHQKRKAVREGRDPNEPCYERTPNGLFCTKVKGHDGPHYCAFG